VIGVESKKYGILVETILRTMRVRQFLKVLSVIGFVGGEPNPKVKSFNRDRRQMLGEGRRAKHSQARRFRSDTPPAIPSQNGYELNDRAASL